jgi:hypothetical protein
VPNKAVEITDRFIKTFYEQTQKDDEHPRYVPNYIPIATKIEQVNHPETDRVDRQMKYEAILRPRKSATFRMLQLILFKLDRSRHLMYVCFNLDSQKMEETHLTIYFLLAYGLESKFTERDNFATAPGDWLFGPDGLFRSDSDPVAKITRVPVELAPLHHLSNGMSDWTEAIPLASSVFRIPGTMLKFSGTLLSRINEKLGAGVERITITQKSIEFANQVDLEHPEDAHVLYELDFAEQGVTPF